MYLTNRNRRVLHIDNGKSVTNVYYDRPGSIYAYFMYLRIYCLCIRIQVNTKQVSKNSDTYIVLVLPEEFRCKMKSMHNLVICSRTCVYVQGLRREGGQLSQLFV